MESLNGLTAPYAVLFAFLELLAANTLAIALFSIDKRRAQLREWRTAESTLLLVAALGGFPGAKFSQRYFRHKTRKQPFGLQLNFIGACQFILVILLLIPASRAQLALIMGAFLDWATAP